jgi:hypothetical protein
VSLEIPWESMTAHLPARAWGTLRVVWSDGDRVAEAVRRGGLYEALTFPAFLTAAGLVLQLITRITLGVPTRLPLPVHLGAIVLWPLGHAALVLIGGMLAYLVLRPFERAVRMAPITRALAYSYAIILPLVVLDSIRELASLPLLALVSIPLVAIQLRFLVRAVGRAPELPLGVRLMASLTAVLPAMVLGSAPLANPAANLALAWVLQRLL